MREISTLLYIFFLIFILAERLFFVPFCNKLNIIFQFCKKCDKARPTHAFNCYSREINFGPFIP